MGKCVRVCVCVKKGSGGGSNDVDGWRWYSIVVRCRRRGEGDEKVWCGRAGDGMGWDGMRWEVGEKPEV
jgi:hypothetical protein